ncbi:TPA: GAF domain-containing sensor histidine kinase [Candidatus Poribacteria bacterium]|nr:GAF domain-containing sensor histidine kinase [Candidatus Poribacteria bacterium]
MDNFSERLSTLYEVSRSLQTLQLEEVLKLILHGVTRTIGFDRARLYLIEREERVLKCVMAVGLELDRARKIILPLDREDSVVARAALDRKPYIIEDALNDPRVNRDLVRQLNVKSFVAVPMIGRERVVGVVSADNLFSEREITEEDFKLLVTFVNQAGIAIENAEMYEELKRFNSTLRRRIREAMKELEESQRQLMQSEKLAALGQIAAGVAHELRNPLTSIKILLYSLMEEFNINEKRPEDVEVIKSEIGKMEELIRRFLDFARPSSPVLERVNVNEVIEGVISLVGYQMKENDIVLRMNLSPKAEIMADRDHLRQLFLNLILNSIQAMPQGGELRIETRLSDGMLITRIKDTGMGIPKPVMDRIFEPFFTTKEEGIGLGLSIVDRIVKEHNGKIEVESAPGEGTEFRVYLQIGGEMDG